jgi:FAD/FMN-containing dehydrogenase
VTDDPTQSCTLGALPYYAVNISTVAQVQLTINFARNNNIRLVVKNTGHDFSGKSGGAGALSIWTHNLKDIEYIPSYSAAGTDYTGPAFKAGVGAQAFEMYEAAHKEGLVVVGGEGKTVGIMGGYIQGGGHSPLSPQFGTGADQVLSMEVTTADGKFVTADFTQNTDLFWALRGGGGSTFGVATSLIVKAYPDLQVTASTFDFAIGGDITAENFWTGIRQYLDHFPSLAAEGIYAYWFILAGETGPNFKMMPFWAPGKTADETNALLAPWLAQLAELNIHVTPNTTNYPDFLTGWEAAFPLEVVEKTHVCSGSRLWPKESWKTKESLDAMFDAVKASVDVGNIIIAYIMDPSATATAPDNAVNPAWRNTYSHMIQSVSWPLGASAEFQLETRKNFTFGAMQRWRDVSPGAGSYLAESDILEPDFQQSFYGSKYERLLKIKKQLDPKDVFFAQTAVGSEFWEVVTANGLPSGNGKLCRVKN